MSNRYSIIYDIGSFYKIIMHAYSQRYQISMDIESSQIKSSKDVYSTGQATNYTTKYTIILIQEILNISAVAKPSKIVQ